MNPIMKLAAKLAALLLPFPLTVMLAMPCFPMQLYKEDYPYYCQHKEYAEGHEKYCRVLIMGDSTAQAALQPKLLSDDTYNYALGGASPIEEYYYLREYLAHNAAPQYLLCVFDMELATVPVYFWDGFVFLHRASADDLTDMKERLTMLSDVSALGVSDADEFAKEVRLYQMYAPQKYGATFLQGLLLNVFGDRYEANKAFYREVLENRGQRFFGTAEYCDTENSFNANMEEFRVPEVTDHYLKKMIELCEANDIQFIFQSPPYIDNTHIRKKVLDEYTAYFEGVQQEHPNAVIDTDICWYGPECFGDASHVNQKGMERYSLETVQKYPDIFQG